jgi:DNA-binding LacI/PurR family transcriptional regulator
MSRNPPGRVKMSDIAQQAKVSRMAVSHVLMGTGKGYIRVSEKTAERIRKIACELGYTPNRAAQQLAGKRSGVLGILANDWMHPTELRVLSWMQQLADQRGFRVLASQTNKSVEPIKRYLADFASRGIDGLIFVAYGNDFLWPLLQGVFHAVPQVVSVLGRPDFGPGYYVDLDYAEGVRQAVGELHRKGRRHVVQVLEDSELLMYRFRVEAFEQTHHELQRGYNPNQSCIATKGWGPDDPGYAPLIDELVRVQKADAILADSDYGALGLIRALHRKGLRVPDDVAVVGWGNEHVASFCDPSLTTVDFPLQEVIGKALDMLATLIENPEQKELQSVVIAPQLIVRESA